MKTILLASAVALALSTGAAYAAPSSNADVSTDTKPASGVQTARQFDSIGSVVAPSWSNPTGQVERGPNGAISLFAPTNNGNG
jgi:hypothetical protein